MRVGAYAFVPGGLPRQCGDLRQLLVARHAALRRAVARAVRATGAARTAGHALPSPVLTGAGVLLRLGITAHDRELPRLAIGRPAGGDGLPDASGPHPRAGAGLPAVRHVPAPAGPRGTPG